MNLILFKNEKVEKIIQSNFGEIIYIASESEISIPYVHSSNLKFYIPSDHIEPEHLKLYDYHTMQELGCFQDFDHTVIRKTNNAEISDFIFTATEDGDRILSYWHEKKFEIEIDCFKLPEYNNGEFTFIVPNFFFLKPVKN